MPFRPLASPRTVRWRPVAGDGLEHLSIEPAGSGLRVGSVVAGSFGARPFGVSYSIEIDAEWRVLSLRIQATDGRGLTLRSPEPGRWLDANGVHRTDLDGCLDIDLAATPFTNTLPIRRTAMAAAAGETAFAMLYVPFDSFEPFPDRQHYAAIEDGRLYRFENDDRSFTAELAVDADGLVLDYPGLFKRL